MKMLLFGMRLVASEFADSKIMLLEYGSLLIRFFELQSNKRLEEFGCST